MKGGALFIFLFFSIISTFAQNQAVMFYRNTDTITIKTGDKILFKLKSDTNNALQETIDSIFPEYFISGKKLFYYHDVYSVGKKIKGAIPIIVSGGIMLTVGVASTMFFVWYIKNATFILDPYFFAISPVGFVSGGIILHRIRKKIKANKLKPIFSLEFK